MLITNQGSFRAPHRNNMPGSKKHARKRVVTVTAADGNGIDQMDDQPRVLPNDLPLAASKGDTARVVAWLLRCVNR